MPKPHKQLQTQGKKQPTAAQVQTGTGPTYGGVSTASPTSTNAYAGLPEDAVITSAPPVPSAAHDDERPLTFGHLKKGWGLAAIILAIASPLAGGVWWMSHLSTKVEQHDGDINEVKTKAEKLEKDSATASAQLQTLNSEVNKLEDRMYNQAETRKQR